MAISAKIARNLLNVFFMLLKVLQTNAFIIFTLLCGSKPPFSELQMLPFYLFNRRGMFVKNDT